jgi:Spy/CpxP family protein refolding chaperone
MLRLRPSASMALVFGVVLVLSTCTWTQVNVRIGSGDQPQQKPGQVPPSNKSATSQAPLNSPASPSAAGLMPLLSNLSSPEGLLHEWWKDPTIAAELRLTEAQKKQLEDATLAQRLALIDVGADGLKAFVRLGVLLDADRIDDTAYKQQLGDLSAVASRLVQSLGEMAATPRRILTPDQWRKLQMLRQQRKMGISQSKPRDGLTPH